MNFKQFLENVTVDIDPTDPAQAMTDVKRATRMANNNPQRYGRQRMQDARDERAQVQQAAEDDPNSQLRMQIAKMKERLARMETQLAAKEKQTMQQGGVPQ